MLLVVILLKFVLLVKGEGKAYGTLLELNLELNEMWNEDDCEELWGEHEESVMGNDQ